VRAARLIGAAEAALTTVGATFAPAGRFSHREAVAAAGQALGEERFAAARAAGGALTPEEALAEALTDAPTAGPPGLPSPASRAGLTARELEVLRLMVDGRSNPEIAAALFISPRTATTHVTHILAKLGAASRTEAATYAVRHGLV
jgi:DNA-binding NarL/FixJ family response regulator